MPDIVIRHATLITMDSGRRVIADGAVAIDGNRIATVGTDSEIAALGTAGVEIDGRHMVVLPGLIDSHSHAGHALVKSLGAGRTGAWYGACEEIYARGSTQAFWRAEARLAALERIKAGVTTCVTLLGGGADFMRTNDPAYGDRHCEATAESGIRCYLAVGPGRPPFPKKYARWDATGAHPQDVTPELQFEVCDDLIRRWNGTENGRVNLCMILPVFSPDELADPETEAIARSLAAATRDLIDRHGVLFTQDGHRNGSIAAQDRISDLLGPRTLFAHSIDLTEEDIAAVLRTGTRIVHNPSAIMSVYGRCPVPELLDLGVTVSMGSDAAAPDRGFDMFRHMTQCMHYHRRHFRDPSVLSPGKVLEMCTIDAARALGRDDEIGSIEPGKVADIILLDIRKPHLYPFNMPVTRVAHFANAADVDTVIVNGRIVMRGRRVGTFDEDEVLDEALHETEAALERTGLRHLTDEPANYWGRARL